MAFLDEEFYWTGYKISFVFVFLGCWIYCIAAYGFLLGVGLGWLPSLIAAGIISLLWPLLLAGIVIIIVLVLAALRS